MNDLEIIVDEIVPNRVGPIELNNATGEMRIYTDRGTLVLRKPDAVIAAAARLLAERKVSVT